MNVIEGDDSGVSTHFETLPTIKLYFKAVQRILKNKITLWYGQYQLIRKSCIVVVAYTFMQRLTHQKNGSSSDPQT